MGKLRHIQSIALFLIVLIISFPFYVSSAEAVSIQSVKVSGTDGIEGYTRTYDDALHVEATLSDPIQSSEIFLDSDALGVPSEPFSSCEGNVCEYFHDIDGLDSKKYTLTLNVDTESGDKAISDATFCADGIDPVVTVIYAKQTGDKITIKFKAEDKGPSGCSPVSIRKADLLYNDEPVSSKQFEGIKSIEEGTFQISQAELGGITDESSFSVEAEDMLGNSGKSAEQTIALDFISPDINEDSVIVTDMQDHLLTYVAGSDDEDIYTTLKVKINITDSDISASDSWADFSSLTLNSQKMQEYKKKAPASCAMIDLNKYECIWDNIEYNGKVAELYVKFHAEDKAGNSDELETTLALERVSSKPRIERIFIQGREDQDPVYLSSKKLYTAVIAVSDFAGFSINKNLQVKMIGLSGVNDLKECKEISKGSWECYFQNLKPNSADKGTISVLSTSENDLGMLIEPDSPTLEFEIDSNDPEIARFSEDGFWEAQGTDFKKGDIVTYESSSCPTYEDDYEFSVLIYDKTQPEFAVDASPISNNEWVGGSCSEADPAMYPSVHEKNIPLYECTASITGIIPTSAENVQFHYNVTDLAGNDIQEIHTIDLCTTDTKVAPDCVSSIRITGVNGDIPSVHKKTLQFSDYPMVLNMEYEFKGCSGLEILSQDMSCNFADIEFITGKTVQKKEPVKKIFAHIKKEGLSAPAEIDYFANDTTDTDEQKLTVECTSTMIIKSKNKIYATPEEEKFSFEVSLVGLMAGEASEQLKSKIESLNKQIKDSTNWADSLELVITILEVICNLAKMISTLNQIIQDIKIVIGGIAIAWANTVVGAWARGLWASMCTFGDTYLTIATEYIWPPGVLPVPPHIGYVNKYICMYLTCQFANPDVIGEAIAEIGSAYLSDLVYSDEQQWKWSEQEGYQTPITKSEFNAVEGGTDIYEWDKGDSFISPISGDDENYLTKPLSFAPRYYDLKSLSDGLTNTLSILFTDEVFGKDENQDFKDIKGYYDGLEYNERWNEFDGDEISDKVSYFFSEPKNFNPYKIGDFSNFCPKAGIYKAKKQKQIICAQKYCYLASIKAGVNPVMCDKARDMHECLYIDGAITKVVNIWGVWWANIFTTLMWSMLSQAAMMAVTSVIGCGEYFNPSVVSGLANCGLPIEVGFPKSAGCGMLLSLGSLNEIYYMIDTFMEDFSFAASTTLTDDYCSLASSLESEVITP